MNTDRFIGSGQRRWLAFFAFTPYVVLVGGLGLLAMKPGINWKMVLLAVFAAKAVCWPMAVVILWRVSRQQPKAC